MPDYRLRIDMKFIRQRREYVIEQRLGNGKLRILDSVTMARSEQSEDLLIEELFAGKIELLGESEERSSLKDKLSKTGVTDLSQLQDESPLSQEIRRRESYVKAVVQAQPLARTAKNLKPLLLKVGQRIGDAAPPSWVTVNRWFRAYVSAGEDVRALAPSHKTRGNRRPKVAGKQREHYTDEDYEKARVVNGIVGQIVKIMYLSKSRPSVQEVHDEIKDRISKENEYRDLSERLPTPHISSLYKFIARLDAYEVDKARLGKRYADEKHRSNKQGPRPKRPLARIEFDHTKIDMMIVDTQTRLPLGRPLLTTMIDVYTKVVVGFYLSFHGEGAVTVMQCLLHAIRPKSYIKSKYPFLENDWPAYGIPEVIVTDNGSGFHSRHYTDACRQLGIEPQYSPIGCPWFRPSIERWFGTLNKRLLHKLPGTTFSNIFEKKDYDPKKHAVISLEALLELIHLFIVDIYHHGYHRGINDIPYKRWVEAAESWSPNLPPSNDELEILIGLIELRRVSRSGVELYGLLYNNQNLGTVRRTLGAQEKVTVKIDPTDISSIYVWDKGNSEFIRVPALDQEYTAGLSLWQHQVIKKFARRWVMGQVDSEGLCRARLKVQEIVERERLITGNTTNLRKAARFMNVSQPDYWKEESASVGRREVVPSLVATDGRVTKLLPGDTMTMINERNGTEDSNLPDVNLLSVEDGWGSDYDLPI